MLQPLSQSEQALRDTLITKAEDYAFDDLQTMYGFERPATISRDTWRQALRMVAYGHRGTLGCTWGMLELGLRERPELRTVTGTLSPASPHQFTGIDFPAEADGFNCEWIGRYVRIRYSLENALGELEYTSKVLYTVSPLEVPHGSPLPTTLHFCPTATGLWETEAVDSPLWALPANASVAVTLELLPFMYREPLRGPLVNTPTTGLPTHPVTGEEIPLQFLRGHGETCLVELYLDASVYNVPATYLLDPPGVDRTTFPGQPYGGHIMDQFGAINGETTPAPPGGTGADVLEVGDPLGEGPHPVYLIDETALAGFRAYFDPILASGVHFEAYTRDFCLFEGS